MDWKLKNKYYVARKIELTDSNKNIRIDLTPKKLDSKKGLSLKWYALQYI